MMRTFATLHSTLREVLKPCEPVLALVSDEPGNYYLNCRKPRARNKEMFFGAVQIRKRYVSYHLMPVYVFPELLETCSPALRKRMHGKSCFNFTRVEPSLLEELRELTRSGLERFREAGML